MLKITELESIIDFLRGRQIAYMVYDHFQATGAFDIAQGLSDLNKFCLHDDDVQDFDTRWDSSSIGDK